MDCLGILLLVAALIAIGMFVSKEISKDAEQRATREKNLAAEEALFLRRQQEEAERRSRHQQEQLAYGRRLATLGEESLSLFESLPAHLAAAERHLNQAQVEFSEGAFSPFWDAVERAAVELGSFGEGVDDIEASSSEYAETAKKYEDTSLAFPVARQSIERLKVGATTAGRMRDIVRTAQRDYQFASIYEQRRTNKILIAGFTNLGEALDQMAFSITRSIDSLASSVGQVAEKLDDIEDGISSHMSEAAEMAADHARREEKVLEMLDNIQRGRRPLE